MAEEKVTRKLAAVLHADVAGYSRLTGADEVGTHRAVAKSLDAMAAMVSDHGGRVVHYAGDAVLAEFPSVVIAVICAVGVQKEMATRSIKIAEDRKVQFRIGVNLGDVIVDRDDIYGNGVNVAARLEALADPGGICVSASVFEQVKGQLDVGFEDMGPQAVKNIAEPVSAYRVLLDVPSNFDKPPPLPDRPSIAVLPCNNLSGDPEQEFFSDGITDDIITDLSKVSGLFVIARNSSFVYKGRAVDVKQVARELGVRYVLTGSVRRGAGKVRINAQLIDAATCNHLWAERYDGDLEDIFALQDQITEKIVATLAVTLTRTEQDRAIRKEAGNLQAYDYVLRGNAYHHRLTKEDNVKARENFQRAIELDPDYAPAYAGLAWVLIHDTNQGWACDPQTLLNLALEYAKRAVRLDDSLAKAHMVLGDAFLWTKQNDQAVDEGRKAVALDPSYADAHFALSVYLRYAGLPEEALEKAKKALRLNPLHGNRLYCSALGRSHYMLKQYAAAVDAGKCALSHGVGYKAVHLSLAAAYAQMGRMEDAQRQAEEVLKIDPNFSVRSHVNFWPYKYRPDADHWLDGLRKAGLPE
ncbi:MAG: adenylate/guanylate cyclase domain-containing protein [Alphaproteobacteria bacterium]|nr:adenylate/guanylate cyclase domain-containing protein [Alphaproteobacteria bacterium]